MIMNTLIGKTMAIWMLAGRPLAGCVFFLVGFLSNQLRRHRRNVIQVDDTIVKPVGKYRI